MLSPSVAVSSAAAGLAGWAGAVSAVWASDGVETRSASRLPAANRARECIGNPPPCAGFSATGITARLRPYRKLMNLTCVRAPWPVAGRDGGKPPNGESEPDEVARSSPDHRHRKCPEGRPKCGDPEIGRQRRAG